MAVVDWRDATSYFTVMVRLVRLDDARERVDRRMVVSWKEANLVSVAGDIKHGVDPGSDLGRGAERRVENCFWLVMRHLFDM